MSPPVPAVAAGCHRHRAGSPRRADPPRPPRPLPAHAPPSPRSPGGSRGPHAIARAPLTFALSALPTKERGFWDDYMHAYEDMIRHTATKDAPWYVVPADNS